MVHYAKEFVVEAHNNDTWVNKYVFNNGDTVDTVAETINDILADIKLWAPKFVITPSYYKNEDGTLLNATFTVRPSTKVARGNNGMKKTFTVYAGEGFYKSFIKNIVAWVDDFKIYCMLCDNVDDYQKIFDEVVAENNIPFTVEFALGTGIIDVSDKHIVLGLSAETVMNFGKLPCYNEMIPNARAYYKTTVYDTLAACAKPMDLVKINNGVTSSLGIFSRKSVVKLIRKSVTRRISYVRTGIGYCECPDYFAVIEKVAVTDAEAIKILENDAKAYIIDNTSATKAEEAAGKTKVHIFYKVSPFNENRETVEVDITTVPDVVAANV